MDIIATGYFAKLPVSSNGRSNTHFVIEDNKPLCGAKVNIELFHWCARGAVLQYLECNKCRELYNKDQQKKSIQLVVEALFVTFECSEAGEVKVPFDQLVIAIDEAQGDGSDLVHFKFYCNCGNEHSITRETGGFYHV